MRLLRSSLLSSAARFVVSDNGFAAAIVHHARRRDGELRRAAGDGFEVSEVLSENALRQLEVARDFQRRWRELDVALFVVELDLQSVLHASDAADLIKEIHVP